MPDFTTAIELLAQCDELALPVSEIMIAREMELFSCSRADVRAAMAERYGVMKSAVRQALDQRPASMGGLIGGEASALERRIGENAMLSGPLVGKALAYSLGVLEVNASMGLVVAAPTAGSSGVVPGVLLAMQEEKNIPEDAIVGALFSAAAIGYLFTRNAFVAGAQGGCQAEVGVASAMAACAAAELENAEPAACVDAASFAIINLLGMVCDPVCGLVEEPCQKRNGLGAANAVLCADMVKAGLKPVAPLDESIAAMAAVGRALPRELRETGKGGIAVAPSARARCKFAEKP